METFYATLNPMLVMFFCILVGYLLNKTHVCPENTGTVLSKLETYCLMPAIGFSTMATYCRPESLAQRGPGLLYGALATGLSVALAYPLARLFAKKGYEKNVYRYALAFANHGFMGNAVVEALFGSAFLFEYMFLRLPGETVTFLWGLPQLIPKEKRQSPWRILLNPPLLGILGGILVGLTGLVDHLPTALMSGVTNLSKCMGPVAMVLTGFIMAQYRLGDLLKNKKVYAISALRLVALPALICLAMYLLGARGNVLLLTMVFTAMPLGLNTVVFPATYGGDPSIGAGMSLVSTTLCTLTFPLMVALYHLLGFSLPAFA